MEDVLDHFATQLLAPPLEDPQGVLPINSMVTSLTNNLSTLFNLAIDRKIQEKIDEINERLDEIKSQTLVLHLSTTRSLQKQVLQTGALRDKPESSSIETEVFGRDENRKDIVSQLLKGDHGDKNYVVIPIVGMGGIGKTTLAQYAYNDEQVRGHFDFKAWMCVSDVFDVKRITMAIVGGEGTFGEFSTLDRAQKQLKEVLTSKRFLIVLDDIWNEEYDDWDQLQAPFQHAAKGSRVIMTTRNMDIARMMNTDLSHNNIINLQGLSDDDCWCVFQQHAGNDSDLAELRDDIIRKCKGLPLAAKALGGLLKKTVDKKRRRMILKSDLWSKESGGLSVLRLSYHYLPFHLKRLFAYCSVLPKDYEFSKREIILLWMAQDFLSNNEEECMEDLGDIYFDDLRSRSLFEKIPRDKEDRFVMHDLIHDLAQWAAGGMCYVMGTKDVTKVGNWQRIRHVFVLKDGHTALESQLPMASQLRTFRCDSIMGIENLNFIEHFHYVRALRLASLGIKVLPECIGELQHLRFLHVKFQSLKELPTSINKLWNLQTLWLNGCCNLEKIPNITSLGKLCHLVIEPLFHLKEMPTGLEKLTNLQSLDYFVLGRGHGARLRELKDLNHVGGRLRICGLDIVSMPENAREARLYKKCRVNTLSLEWGDGRDEVNDDTKREVVEQLKPPISIKDCSLKGYKGVAFPGWLGDPCFINMVDIHLINCEKCECLPPLGQLPWLKNLEVHSMYGIVKVGPEFYGNLKGTTIPFPTLKSLAFRNMESWERWLPVDHDRAFPCLEHLYISTCYSLQGDVPPHLPSLKTLEFLECKQLKVSVPLQSLPWLEELEIKEGKILLQLITSTAEGALQEEHGQSPSPKGITPFELPYLTKLEICGSPILISFPDALLLPSLEKLHIIDCENMESLPSELHTFTSLQRLEIWNSPKIQCFPEGGLPKNLKKLDIRNLNINQLHSLPSSLCILIIEEMPNLKSIRCSC